MSDTLTQLQVKVRWQSRDSAFSLTDDTGLAVTNGMYRRLAAIIPWPELNRTDTSRSTTEDQEAVTWPSVKFADVTSVELQDPNDNLKYQVIVPARTEQEWSIAREAPAGFPQMYKRAHDGTQNVVQFAPKPNTGSLTVRVTGYIEPTEVTAAASTTVFIAETPDDILSLMISADIADKRNQPVRAQSLAKRAAELLSGIAGREITPAEIKSDVESG